LSLFALGREQRRRKARAQARASVQAALDCFSELGATPYARFARVMLEQLGGSRGGGSALTDAERRIADLLATGMSNREIATALYSSVRTVEGHLSSIYRKLGIHSRTELIRRHSRA
jgi:DNA-binding NarL/FixJ family response regulator